MAKELLTPEESDLRRRARRRLVGAIALALVAVVVLPLVFNPEPKPLGSDVDIRIPDQATPFEPGVPASPTPEVTPPPVADTAEASQPAPATPAPATTAPATTAPTAKPAAPDKAEPQPRPEPAQAPEKPAAVKRPPEAKPVEPKHTEPKPAEPTPADKDTGKPSAQTPEAMAARGYFLQLGAFSSEVNARQLADKARAAGFQVAVQNVAGQVRVRVGPYQDRKAALEMQAKLRAKGFGPVLLGP